MSEQRRGRLVNRREFLGVTAGGAAALALAACTPTAPAGSAKPGAASGGAPAGSGGGKKPNYPTYIAAPIPKPDHDPSAKGYEAGYVNFPKELTKTVKETPAKGGTVTGMVLGGVNALPTPVDKNTAWQQLNKALGTDLQINVVPQPDYAAKWGTVTAGNDLPDLMYVSIVPALPNVPAFLRAKCTNMTPFIGGDAVKEYPNLANIPQSCWRVAMLDGDVWGVPIARPVTGTPMYVQTTLLQKLGMAVDKLPTNADDFKAFCKALTNPQQGLWAFGNTNDSTAGPYSMNFFQGIFRAPNQWKLENGKLTKDIETEEYKAALAYLRDLVAAGYQAPDLKSNAELNNELFGGRIAMRANSWNGYQSLYTDQAASLGQKYRIIPPFGHDGKPGVNILGPGNFGWVIMKKVPDDRAKELLRVVNHLAAPFGSEEYMVNKFGVKDQDYRMNEKGSPVITDQGKANLPGTPTTTWAYLGNPPPVLFSTVVSEYANFAHEDEVKLIDAGVGDPTLGYFSQTDADKGVTLSRLIFDRVSGIAAGRAPVSDLDALVKDWKAQGGDQMREEYQKSIAG